MFIVQVHDDVDSSYIVPVTAEKLGRLCNPEYKAIKSSKQVQYYTVAINA